MIIALKNGCFPWKYVFNMVPYISSYKKDFLKSRQLNTIYLKGGSFLVQYSWWDRDFFVVAVIPVFFCNDVYSAFLFCPPVKFISFFLLVAFHPVLFDSYGNLKMVFWIIWRKPELFCCQIRKLSYYTSWKWCFLPLKGSEPSCLCHVECAGDILNYCQIFYNNWAWFSSCFVSKMLSVMALLTLASEWLW